MCISFTHDVIVEFRAGSFDLGAFFNLSRRAAPLHYYIRASGFLIVPSRIYQDSKEIYRNIFVGSSKVNKR
jgi:hypothetical protein